MRDSSAAVDEAGSPAIAEPSGLNLGLVAAFLWCAIFWEVVVLAVLTLLGVPATVRAIQAHGSAAYAWRARQEEAGRAMGATRAPAPRLIVRLYA